MPTRSYLQLGLSDNVNYTFDASRAEGDRITSIWVDGTAIDPTKSYRIGTFNFLLTGGDNFREFLNRTNTRDSGLVDRDAWISYIRAQSPLTPSFAARQAQVTGVPAGAVDAGDTVTLTVSGLNLTSLGAPKNTELALRWPGSTVNLGTASVDAAGSSTVTVTVPWDAKAAGVFELTAKESGTIVRVALAVNVLAPPTAAPVASVPSALTQTLRDAINADAATYRAGDTIAIGVGAQRAGEYVSVWLRSAPANLGGWLPANIAPGTHRLIVQDATGAVIGWADIKVQKAAKPLLAPAAA